MVLHGPGYTNYIVSLVGRPVVAVSGSVAARLAPGPVSGGNPPPNMSVLLFLSWTTHTTVCCCCCLPCNQCSNGHGLLKKFWPMVIGCALRTAGSSIIWNYADPLTSLELLNTVYIYSVTLIISGYHIQMEERGEILYFLHKGVPRSYTWGPCCEVYYPGAWF